MIPRDVFALSTGIERFEWLEVGFTFRCTGIAEVHRNESLICLAC